MIKHFLVLIACITFSFNSLFAQNDNFLLLNKTNLENIKKKASNGDAIEKGMVDNMLKQANNALNAPVLSVTSKSFLPASGDKHDYLSLATYYWPDSTKLNGKQTYVRRDGLTNPEIKKYSDETQKNQLVRYVKLLALAYYFSNDEKYAVKAATLLRGWFIDTATRMNPNLNYAQFVPGVNSGRGAGLIETTAFIDLPDAIKLIEPSSSWTSNDDIAIKQWFSNFLDWMQTSKNGKAEQNNKNNHGTWYDAQIISYALFINKNDFAKQYIQTTTLKRIADQFDTEGKQHYELTRTKGLSYSTFNLEAWFKIASLADNLNIDIWHYNTADNKSLKKAFDWLLPYALGNKKWEYQQIIKYDTQPVYEILTEASRHYQDSNYIQLAKEIQSEIKDPIVLIMYNIIV